MFEELQGRRFSAVIADPPWAHRNFSPKGGGRAASNHYSTMELSEICAMPVKSIAAKDCHLFLWTTGPHLQEAFEVMEAWGFRYSSIAFTWVKLKKNVGTLFWDPNMYSVGLGKTTRKNTEIVLLGRRGNPRRLSKSVRELIVEQRRQHSRKPEQFYQRVVEYCTGPYIELFSRRERPGWTVWGNESTKFGKIEGGTGEETSQGSTRASLQPGP